MPAHISPLGSIALVCAALASFILIWFLIKHPPIGSPTTKLWLFVGLGILPIGVASTGNIEGFKATKQREFCGSCHVMTPYSSDSNDPKSLALASRHARNKLFGNENCYVCHADYGMFGTVLTKMGGMRHVWHYALTYRKMTLEESKLAIHLRQPYPNENCMQCHSTKLDLWQKHPDHKASLDGVRTGKISCASAGCHGYAHPFTKPSTSASAGAAPVGSHL
jgi:nitrate/TMAO reductase-like tetraheme cytochrome c subunit